MSEKFSVRYSAISASFIFLSLKDVVKNVNFVEVDSFAYIAFTIMKTLTDSDVLCFALSLPGSNDSQMEGTAGKIAFESKSAIVVSHLGPDPIDLKPCFWNQRLAATKKGEN